MLQYDNTFNRKYISNLVSRTNLSVINTTVDWLSSDSPKFHTTFETTVTIYTGISRILRWMFGYDTVNIKRIPVYPIGVTLTMNTGHVVVLTYFPHIVWDESVDRNSKTYYSLANYDNFESFIFKELSNIGNN